ncbi:HutD family protein [Pseudomonas paraeruginosa]|uniref:HutD/Ves family protein n=1 Tax=Pseudomonas paraeruginosa TaxID=2994495 RepID=UPI0039FC856A
MSEFRILRAVDYPRMPWKNGAGSTEEIARDGGDGLDGFGWRLSIADVGESGGFSRFAGYQRIISVLQGGGMRLRVDGADTPALRERQPFAFSGDSEVHCTLLDGAIRDFNLIYYPQRYRARLQWLRVEEALDWHGSASTVLLFAQQGEVAVSLQGQSCGRLGAHDCLQAERLEGLQHWRLAAHEAAWVCAVELEAR